jgi:hypothetical protein
MTIAIDPTAPLWAQRFRLAIETSLDRQEFPKAPSRLAVFATAADLPDAARWRNSIASCSDIGGGIAGLVWSNGSDWYPVTVGSAL